MAKTSDGFENALAFISLFGFLVIALNSFSNFDLSPWSTTVVMIFAGGALILEGELFSIKKWGRDGFQRPEYPKIISIVLGIFTIVVGILAIPSINLVTPQLQGIIGFIAICCMVFISLEKWVY